MATRDTVYPIKNITDIHITTKVHSDKRYETELKIFYISNDPNGDEQEYYYDFTICNTTFETFIGDLLFAIQYFCEYFNQFEAFNRILTQANIAYYNNTKHRLVIYQHSQECQNSLGIPAPYRYHLYSKHYKNLVNNESKYDFNINKQYVYMSNITQPKYFRIYLYD